MTPRHRIGSDLRAEDAGCICISRLDFEDGASSVMNKGRSFGAILSVSLLRCCACCTFGCLFSETYPVELVKLSRKKNRAT